MHNLDTEVVFAEGVGFKSINQEQPAMKNIFAVVGCIVIATKGYELYREYSERKRRGRRQQVRFDLL